MTAQHNVTRRIYVEMISHSDLCALGTLALLKRYDLEVVLAIRPWDVAGLPDILQRLTGAGLRVSLWPMVANADGRWASVWNGERFAAFVRAVLDAAQRGGHGPTNGAVFLDFEPPFEAVKRLSEGARGLLRAPRRATPGGAGPRDDVPPGARHLTELCQELRAQGYELVGTVVPLLVFGDALGAPFAGALGTPAGSLAQCTQIDAMSYSSMFEGWSYGVLRRNDAASVLADVAGRAVERFGSRAALSLGAVGVGALGTEPCYRGPEELAEDVRIASAAGITQLSLFELRGVLSRAPAEAWLEAFTAADFPGPRLATRAGSRRARWLGRFLERAGIAARFAW